MRNISRLLLLLCSAALIVSILAMYSGTTYLGTHLHDTFYRIKYPWMHNVRDIAFIGVLVWSFLYLRKDILFARIGLAAAIAATLLLAYFTHRLP